ncbi:MAG: heavy metal translocating P-type ATPase [Actinomycetaceae bacterium]|nr:heavy metal translocating P-type ATPase [Actinomycetaceae bacterium]
MSGPNSVPTTLAPAPTPRLGENLLRRAATLRVRLIVAAILSTPVMVLSMVPAWQFSGWQWVCAALATPVVTWVAWPFHSAAIRAGRHGTSTMDTLVSLGVSAAYLWSLWALFFGGAGKLGMTMDMSLLPRTQASAHPHVYFEAATMVTTFLLAGRFAEARARYRAGDALRSLLELGAKTARLVAADGSTREVPTSDLNVGDVVLVRPGEKIPADGVVESGQAALDTALITGESVPVHVGPGSEVTGATINTDGALRVRLTRVGEETTLAQIGRLVTQAQAGKAPVQRLADRVASVFVPVVLAIATLTLVGWLLLGGSVQAAFTAAVAVLVIACPCALGLATPTALLVGSGRAAQLGIVIKGPEILEATRVVDTAVFDKTGTLTQAKMKVTKVVASKSASEEPPTFASGDSGTGDFDDSARQVLALAAAVEGSSSHPVAHAITEAAESAPAASAFTNHAGRGVSALVGKQMVYVGSPSWIEQQGADLSRLREAIEDGYRCGATVTVVGTAPVASASAVGGHASEAGGRGAEPHGSAAGGPAPEAVVPVAEPHASAAGAEENAQGEHVSQPGVSAPSESTDDAHALDTDPVRVIDLGVTGMTCAACVRRVERKLSKLPGVEASVNLATESAQVTVSGDVSDQQLVETVQKLGYGASVLGQARSGPASGDENLTSRPTQAEEVTTTTGPITAIGCLWVADQVKDDAAKALARLKELDIKPVLLTGDNAAAAQAVAGQLGIEEVHAEVLPADKQEVVAQLQAQGRTVAMIGDGVNDAAALAQAGQQGLGMAMGSGTDVAIEAADITLMGKSVTTVPTAIALSRRTLRIIKQNLFWAFAYNVAAIPLAVAGVLNPMIAGAAMAMSSVIVVSNSLRLRSFTPEEP